LRPSDFSEDGVKTPVKGQFSIPGVPAVSVRHNPCGSVDSSSK
jgi:hypothetical protein